VEGCQVNPIPGKTIIEPLVARLSVAIQARSAAFRDPALDLFKVLIAPVFARLASYRELLIIPDGVLNLLPFELLLSEGKSSGSTPLPYLLRTIPIRYAPSAATLLTLASSPGAEVAYGADFVGFAPVDFAEPGPGMRPFAFFADGTIPRLKHTEEEVVEIAAMFPKGRGLVRVRKEATRANLEGSEVKGARYLHFATHGVVDNARPLYSGLLLSAGSARDGGYLCAYELMSFRFAAEMIVLSACQTAQGKLVKGEGVVGLSRACLCAGARRAVVSLWAVNDRSTAELMKTFYTALRRDPQPSHADALRLAKLSLADTPEFEFGAPFFWAAFVLHG